MYAIRQIQDVHTGTVTIQLPPDFPADRVEVIVMEGVKLVVHRRKQ